MPRASCVSQPQCSDKYPGATWTPNLVLCAGQTLSSPAQSCQVFISDSHGPWRVICFIIYLCGTAGAPNSDPLVDAEQNSPDPDISLGATSSPKDRVNFWGAAFLCCLQSPSVHFHLCAALVENCPSTFSFYFFPLDNIELSSCIRIGTLHGLGFGIGFFFSSSEIKTFYKIEKSHARSGSAAATKWLNH